MVAAPARTCAVKRARRAASTARAGSSAGQGAPHSGVCAAAWRARQRALQYRGRAHAAQASRAGGRGHRHVPACLGHKMPGSACGHPRACCSYCMQACTGDARHAIWMGSSWKDWVASTGGLKGHSK